MHTHTAMRSSVSNLRLLIHGGAGVIQHKGSDAESEARSALVRSLQCGFDLLRMGKTALDAVVTAVQELEDSPQFNAGRGAVYTHSGTHELDAAVMDGATRKAGAVAGVHTVRNPVVLARAVMEVSPHVLLVGDGAELFAREHGMATAEPAYFDTKVRWDELQQALRSESTRQPDHYGTVGAVALDSAGHLAAATSTGGMNDKLLGRVGDTAVIGAGTYANAVCAVSGTGWGEFYIRTVAAYAICTRVLMLHEPVERAAEQVINQEIPSMGGRGGAIALAADGHFAMPFNTPGMFRGYVGGDASSRPVVAVWRDDPPQ